MDFSDYLSFLNLGAIIIPVIFMIALGLGIAIFVRMMGKVTAPAARKHSAELGYKPAHGSRQISMFRQSDHQIREYGGWEILFATSRKTGIVSKFSESWVCQLPTPVQFGLQVIEKSEAPKPGKTKKMNASQSHSFGSSMGRGSRGFAWYSWKQHFSERLDTGDPALDSRFAVFGTDLNAIRILLTNPNMRQALLALKHIDLSAFDSEVRFDDPFKDNTLWNRVATIEDLQRIHNQIADVLTLTADAVTQSRR